MLADGRAAPSAQAARHCEEFRDETEREYIIGRYTGTTATSARRRSSSAWVARISIGGSRAEDFPQGMVYLTLRTNTRSCCSFLNCSNCSAVSTLRTA